jgi:SPOR domain
MREALQRAPAAALLAVAVVALLAGAAAGVALSEITSDDGDDAPAAEQSGGPGRAAPAGGGERRQRAATESTTTATSETPRRRLLLDWPDGLTAHTVVLVTSSDRPAALRLARQAARTGIEAGLLRADDYDLGSGMWIVFAGRFDTREGASRQAIDLAERFPGAYPQLIRPAG